ncbi:MAG: hypothetical protein HDT34_04345 [Clostridiales bacterium]|nr:hypothetical protein [Clostridiales bacterium]
MSNKPSIKKYNGKINWDDFTPIPVSDGRVPFTLTVNSDGFILINQKFYDALKSKDVFISKSDDLRMLIINENGESNISFPKNGRKRNLDFCDCFKAKKLSLPVKYDFSYCEESDVWVGECTNFILQKVLSKSTKSQQKKANLMK